MKQLFAFAALWLSTAASADPPDYSGFDLETLREILNSEAASGSLGSHTIVGIELRRSNESTTWTYTAAIRSVEPTGSDHCTTWLHMDVIGGVAGNDTGEPHAESDCAP